MTITNPKLTNTAPPVWRRFHGVSWLYDPPGTSSSSGLERLEDLPAGRGRDLRLFHRLSEVAAAFAAAARPEGVEVALLPPRSYHVTLCDAVNDGNRDRVRGDRRAEVSAAVAAVPDSLLWSNPTLRLLLDRELSRSVWTAPISFVVEHLEVRGTALVAALQPADGASQDAALGHQAARERFVGRLDAELGIDVQSWFPHVTVGYLADDDEAARARDLVAGWQETLAARVAGAQASFRSASLYGFTDMASYWRLGG